MIALADRKPALFNKTHLVKTSKNCMCFTDTWYFQGASKTKFQMWLVLWPSSEKPSGFPLSSRPPLTSTARVWA